MNVFYTGLGIARSLGERGIPVIGLTSGRGMFGNFTRRARVVRVPDSRHEPETLLPVLLELGRKLGNRPVIFPTRDDDLVFLDGHRAALEACFSIVAPPAGALAVCLNKFETYRAAERAGIASPRTWMIEGDEDVARLAPQLRYPCVLKPVSSHQWRQGDNWELVGARKAIAIPSEVALFAEYRAIARAGKTAVLQELVPGPDDGIVVQACYVDRHCRYAAGFEARKLVQVPEGFGTGCIVQSVSCPELAEPTRRLLESIRFTGIAEVEYKWDTAAGEYKLIEINPRPWDQHRLGNACGVDLIHFAYCEHAGLTAPQVRITAVGHKWIAEDTFLTTVLRLAWRRDRRLFRLFSRARGKRLFAIWSARDPLPFLAWLSIGFVPTFMAAVVQWLRSRVTARAQARTDDRALSNSDTALVYEKRANR